MRYYYDANSFYRLLSLVRIKGSRFNFGLFFAFLHPSLQS